MLVSGETNIRRQQRKGEHMRTFDLWVRVKVDAENELAATNVIVETLNDTPVLVKLISPDPFGMDDPDDSEQIRLAEGRNERALYGPFDDVDPDDARERYLESLEPPYGEDQPYIDRAESYGDDDGDPSRYDADEFGWR